MRPLRVLALVQLLLVLPLMGSRAICIPLDATEAAESGFCVCTVASPAADETSMRPADGAECGPCHDVSLNALRVQGSAAPLAPALIATPVFSCNAVLTQATPVARRVLRGEPSGTRQPILRC